MSWNEHRIEKFKEFADFIEALNIDEIGNVSWYFRGQSDSRWNLEPSLIRQLADVDIKTERAIGIEFGATRRFISHFYLHHKSDTIDRSKMGPVAWWMIMQHYACPTRLLDWTHSPFVALYFAIENHSNCDGSVWLFPANALETNVTKLYGKLDLQNKKCLECEPNKAIYPLETTIHNERSAAQQAVFTICTSILSDHNSAIVEAFKGEEHRYPLHKIIIAAKAKNEILIKLRSMNIIPSSLFPGLDGVGRSSRDYIQMRVWQTSKENIR